MPTLELTDAACRAAVDRSGAAGFASASEYVAAIVLQDAADLPPDVDHLFTPERMARIDARRADLAAGRTYAAAEVDAHLTRRRAERTAPR